MKLLHVSITARDADALSDFYQTAFGLTERLAPKKLSGAKVSRGNGLPGAEIYVIWLSFPRADAPFLEIMEYKETRHRLEPQVNEPGYGHIAIEVEDIEAIHAMVIDAGGASQGQITDFGTRNRPCRIVYMRDPEGNILELEQR